MNLHRSVNIESRTVQYKSAPFKVADRYHWIVVLGNRQHIDELRKAPDDALSFLDAANDVRSEISHCKINLSHCRQSIQMKYTMGPELLQNLYHVEIIRSHLTRSLSSLYSEIRDEVSVAFDEVLDLRDSGERSDSLIVLAWLKSRDFQSGRVYVPLAPSRRSYAGLATDSLLAFHYVCTNFLCISPALIRSE